MPAETMRGSCTGGVVTGSRIDSSIGSGGGAPLIFRLKHVVDGELGRELSFPRLGIERIEENDVGELAFRSADIASKPSIAGDATREAGGSCRPAPLSG